MPTADRPNWIMLTGGRKTIIWSLARPNTLNYLHKFQAQARWSSASTDTGHSPCYLHKDAWRHHYESRPPASTSVTSLASARSPCTPWNCCAVTAWATTRWGTSTRPSYSPSCCMLHLHGGVLPARPTNNVLKHLYDVPSGLASTLPTQSHSVTTVCWHGRLETSSQTLNNPHHVLHKLLPDKTGRTYMYNLRAVVILSH